MALIQSSTQSGSIPIGEVTMRILAVRIQNAQT